MKFFLTLVFVVSFAVAQAPPAADAKNAPSRLEGFVVGSNKEVIPRVTLRLQIGIAGASYSTVSGDDGRFVFEAVAPGRYTLSAEKNGYLRQFYGAAAGLGLMHRGTVLDLAGGEVLKDLSIQMTRHSVVSGRVKNREDAPVVGALVSLLRYQYRNGRRELASVAFESTNDLGEFRIAGLSHGRYYLVASHIDQRGSSGTDTNITTFYPSAGDSSAAAPLDVPAESELRTIEIWMQRSRTHSIRGKAVFLEVDSRRPGLRIRIESRDRRDWRINQVVVNAAGEFEFRNLLPGRYLLSTPLTGTAASNLTGRMEVTVNDSDVNDVVMDVGLRSNVTGRLEMEDGSRARVSSLALVANNGSGGWSGQLKSDGTFEVTNLQAEAGGYFVRLTGLDEDAYVKSVEFNGQDATHQAVDPGSGGTVRIVLSTKAAQISGTVQDEDGKMAAGVTVTAWPKSKDSGRANGGARQANTDQYGRFRLAGLPPGDYLIAAWEDLEQSLAESIEFLALFSGNAKELALQESAREEVELQPVPRKKIVEEIAKLP